ncbi:MAG: hypothetical protein J6M01_01340 [Prevotella sp.]|nr:hypothetical protein [Prevotella sp.]
MKKNYIAPTMQVVPMQTTKMLCASVESNVLFEYGGETPPGFSEDNIR